MDKEHTLVDALKKGSRPKHSRGCTCKDCIDFALAREREEMARQVQREHERRELKDVTRGEFEDLERRLGFLEDTMATHEH